MYALGAAIFTKSPTLLKDVKKVLSLLSHSYQLILYTLGDVATQQRIIKALKLELFFADRIYIVSEKTSVQLEKVLQSRHVSPTDVLMVGNSMKSDINPALELGIKCVWVNQHSWAYDNGSPLPGEVIEISHFRELLRVLAKRLLSQKRVHGDVRPFVRV
jgi:putative hydrolase of the HAD superfamily